MNYKDSDKLWMYRALELAERAEAQGEVPVGAVLVLQGKKIGEGYNSSITYQDPTAHAEIIALREGGRTIGNYRLSNVVMYVTLEPCIMCAGAIIHARVSRVVFGAQDAKNSIGITGSSILNNRIKLCSGVLEEACSLQLKDFFHSKRAQN
nr:tRNA adenosine(34) deaminase TadA [Candidatus Baumannia cicadellinicola]